MEERPTVTLTLTEDEVRTLKEILNLQRALADSITPSEITGVAARFSEVLPLAEVFSRTETVRAMQELGGELPEIIGLLLEYHRSGVMQRALEAMGLLSAIITSIGSETAVRFAKAANKALVSADRLISDTRTPDAISGITDAAREAAQKAANDSSTLGLVGILRALKEPSVQKALKFLLHFVRTCDERQLWRGSSGTGLDGG